MVEIKQKNFRFSKTTIDNLKELVELGLVRNETEAVDMAIMHFLTEKKTEMRFKVSQTPRPGDVPSQTNNTLFDVFSSVDGSNKCYPTA